MATKTTNYDLTKIELTDAPPDITVLNENWDKVDAKLKDLEDDIDDRLPLSGGVLEGALTVKENFNINKMYDETEYKSYFRPLNYALGGEYTTGIIHFIGGVNNAQFLFNRNGVALRDNVTGKLYQIFGQHNGAAAATAVRPHLYTYGTTEMTEGTSELPTGALYFVYE